MAAETPEDLINLLNAGAFEQVAAIGASLTKSEPSAAVPWALLAAAQAGLGKWDDAEAHYLTAIALAPDFIDARFNLGLLYFQKKAWADARACFETVLKQSPSHAQARVRLANTRHAQNELSDAAALYADAISHAPQDAQTRANYASALMGLNRLAAAISEYDEAVRLDPEQLEYRVDRAQALLHHGCLEAARADLTAVLEKQPHHAKAHFRLSTFHRYESQDPMISQLDSALSMADAPLQDQVYLHFARAKAFEDCGELGLAFDHFCKGNALQRRLFPYHIADEQAAFEALKAQQTADLLPPLEAAPPASPRPIFVLGLPRSGTSLVEQILASHSHVTGGGELSYFEDAMAEGATPEQWRASYLRRLQQLDLEASVITDKRPLNFKWIGFILQALPEAKVIHVRRDPEAAGWSMFKHLFELPSAGFTNDLSDIAAIVQLHADLMAHFEAEFPDRIYNLSYERLTEDQEAETRKLLEACALPWEDACLAFHENERAVQTASAAQVRQKMYRGSSEAWRQYEPQLKGFLNALGAE